MGPVRPPRSAVAAAAAAAAIARASGVATAIAPHASTTMAAAVGNAQAARPAPAAVAKSSSATASSSSSRDHVVRLLTFNLWFEPLAMAARMRAIGSYIERLRPAVIGFQEVTRESLAMLRKQRWAAYYDCSVDAAPPFSEAYFVVLFSALRVLSLESHPFAQTGMGRELLAARVEVTPGRSLLVATSHLESLPQFARERVSQLKQSLAFLQERVDDKTLGAVLMGDTNLMRGDLKLLDPLAHEVEITMEDAKTSRSKCRSCGESIEKGATRVGKTAKDTLPNGKTVEITMWFHRECFLADGKMPESEKRVVREAMALPGKAEGKQDEDDKASRGLPPHWRDLWLAVPGNTEANGFTYDAKRNTMIRNKAYQSRLDRVYLYAPTPAASRSFESIDMIGTQPIADGLWASDHFGLLTTLCFDEAVKESSSDGDSDADVKRKRSDAEGDGEKETDALKRRASGSMHAPIELE